VAINGNADASVKAFFEIFIRHVSLVDTKKLERLRAPVWLWQAEASWFTNGTLLQDIGQRITRGRFTQELVGGRHFAVMHAPQVSTLATRLAHALAHTEEVRPVELPTGTGAVPTVSAQ